VSTQQLKRGGAEIEFGPSRISVWTLWVCSICMRPMFPEMYIDDDLETITNSMMCKVRLVYHLQSVPHPMKNAPIILPHHVTPPEMKTCCRYGQVSPRLRCSNDDGCCHLLVICLLCFNLSSTVTHGY